MAEYIMAIIKSQIMIMFSWGFNSPMRLPNNEGLAFKVNGYKHRGWVIVRYDEGKDLFNVELLDANKKSVSTIEGVYFDSLVDTIDEAVEKTTDYENRVRTTYNLK